MPKRFVRSLIILFGLTLGCPLVHAVSYPLSEQHRQLSSNSSVKAGGTIYLFYSGTPDISTIIAEGDTLIVYGERLGRTSPVGKVVIRAKVGQYYLKGEVTEGEIRHDDMAKKGRAACLVILETEMLQ